MMTEAGDARNKVRYNTRMKNQRLRLIGFALAALLVFPAAASADDAALREFFEQKIRPVLVTQCYECHSSAQPKPKGGLLLDSRAGVRKGGESGPAVVPGDVENSLLIEAIRHQSLEMPPSGKLPPAVIDGFVKWVEMGAPDPRDAPSTAESAAKELWEAQYEKRRQWWSLKSVSHPAIPKPGRQNWSGGPIDRFILAKLEEEGLQPAPRADRLTLARRLSFVLTGLPPKPDLVQKFANDNSPQAWENLVERMLASPHFGEHWARHWMDVVRYTDTYGYEWDIPAKGAWRYRDYLIRAFNADVPFDQLVREQIAGDLLEKPRIHRQEQINESLIGVMFYQMGEKRHGDSSEFNGIHQEMLDNKIDAFSKTFQAMTIACARCHDHKLDAIAQREYYALAGVFMSSRWVTNTLDLPQRNALVFEELKNIKAKLRPLLAGIWVDDLQRISAGDWSKLAAKQKKAAPLEDPIYVWSQLQTAQAENLHTIWRKQASLYESESKKRRRENSIHFKLAADFREGIPDGWSVDGVGLREITPPGDFTVALEGEQIVGQLLPGGLFTGALSPRLNGALRTPYLNRYENGHISFEAHGGDFAARRTVIDNAFLTEKQIYISQKHPAGLLMWTHKSMKDRRVYIEFATKTSNPNFPPRVGLGGKCDEKQAADPRSWFGITRAFLHEAGHTPKDELDRFFPLFEGEAPVNIDQAAKQFREWFEQAVNAWAENRAGPDEVRLINWLLDNQLLTNQSRADAYRDVAALVRRYREMEKQIRLPWTVNGMADLDPGYDYRLNIRGDYDQLGEPAPRGYVACIGGWELTDERDKPTGSGRRELAEVIASPHNPLTGRVFVNRVWQHLFERGIVSTPNDFGHLGESPTHPKLLDFLTSRFIAEGWSLKKLVRSIVLSETWRQSGATTAQARRRDPRNRLVHHYPIRRLEAESLRDAMLATSGRLVERLFGPPTNPFRANEDPQKRLFSGPVDGDGRRSIYTKITIMEPPRFLTLFNQPKPKIPTGRRDVANTPAQSLALLNDPLVVQQSEVWARRLIEQNHKSVAQRVARMFESALGRKPLPDEIRRWRSAATDFASAHKVAQENLMTNVAVWRDLAHAMFNVKEFIYIR